MKLLTKSEIAMGKAKERQLEMTEGMKLAHRVDSLRKVAADEASALEKFRSESMKTVQSEIAVKTSERDILIVEVSKLQAEKEEALKPFTRELRSIAEERGSLLMLRDETAEREKNCITRERELDKRQKDQNTLEKRIEQTRLKANEELQIAEQKNIDATSAIKDSRAMFDAISTQCTTREKNVALREEMMEKREKTMLENERAVNKHRQENIDQQRRLEDREGTLLRNLNRK